MKVVLGLLFVLFSASPSHAVKANEDVKVINFRNMPLKAKYLNKIYSNFDVVRDYNFVKDKNGLSKSEASIIIKLKANSDKDLDLIKELSKIDGIDISKYIPKNRNSMYRVKKRAENYSALVIF